MAQFLQKKKKKQVLHLKKKAKVKSKDGKITLPGEQKQPRGKAHVLSPSFMGFPIMKKAPGPPQRCGDLVGTGIGTGAAARGAREAQQRCWLRHGAGPASPAAGIWGCCQLQTNPFYLLVQVLML